MAARIGYKQAAVAELGEAFQWYERERPGLGREFLAEITRVERHLVEGDLRRATLRRFPYGLFYLIEDDSVIIVACMHLHRDPKTRVELLRRM